MKHTYSLDKDWKFIKDEDLNFNAASDYFDMFSNISKTGVAAGAKGESIYDNNWRTVDIPHDWMVEQSPCPDGIKTQGYRKSGRAWYRKHFSLPQNIDAKHVFLRFDAISIHSQIYVNSVKVAEESCGSTGIYVEITDFIEENRQICVAVSADNYTREGWWYEGGGIFGHTYLIVTSDSYIEHNSLYAVPRKVNDGWNLCVEAKAAGGTRAVCEVAELGLKAECGADNICFDFSGITPELWSPENPKLYKLTLTLFEGDNATDIEEINIGFRECVFHAEKGFFLNGERRKLKGICMHNDHAGVGIALTDGLMEYRLKKLKQMGCDAIRTSHNPYLPEFYDLCDRMGFLVMDEVRHFSSTKECLLQLEKFVKRDRNHPSVIMWSIFNEENLQCTVRGRKIAKSMMRLIKSLDASRPITGGMNGPMEPEGVVNVIDMVGFNYMQYNYDTFHAMHPEIPMFASETASYLTSRGEVLTDMKKDRRSSYKRVMNENLFPWSNTPGMTWKNIEERDYLMGGFYWTAFDYRGECEDYPSNISSFGAMDLCGFPKDSFFWNRVLWCDEPRVYLSPYRQDAAEIACYSNCEQVKLYMDNAVIAEMDNDKYNPPVIPLANKGVLRAEGYNGGVKVCEITASLAQKAQKLECDVFTAEDTIIVDYMAYDSNNIFVPDADNLISFEVCGGTILGVGNGDTKSLESDKSNARRLYNGCCQLIIRPENDRVTVRASTAELEENLVDINVNICGRRAEINSENCRIPVSSWRMTDPLEVYPKDNIADLIFAWIPTTVGYGKNLMFSGKCGYGMIAGTFAAPDADADFVIEKIEGAFDLYFEQKLMLQEVSGIHKNVGIKIPKEFKGENVCVTIVFKMHNDDCGIVGNVYVE